MSDVEIKPVDPLDLNQTGLFEAWVGTHAAADNEVWNGKGGAWSADEVRELHRASTARRTALAAVDPAGAVLGAVQVIEPIRDNFDRAHVWLSVRPDWWRRGIGSTLLLVAEGLVRAAGRTVISDQSHSPQESGGAGAAFARQHGYSLAQIDLRQELVLPEGAAAAHIDDFTVGGENPAYLIETVWDTLPEEWLEDRAFLGRRMSTDAPMGEHDFEEEAWDVGRVRDMWARGRAQGRRSVESVARHVASGKLIAFTDLSISASTPRLGYQQDTLVLSEHRGKGLGRALKRANLAAVRQAQPQVRTIRTWNARSNEPMLRVNRELGFVVTGYTHEWQKRLT